MDDKKIYTNHALDEYNKKYKNRKHRLLKYTKKQIEDFDKKYSNYVFNGKSHNLELNKYLLKNKKWALIGDTYYEIPKPLTYTWFRNLNVGVQALTCLLGATGITSAVTFPILAVTIWNKVEEVPVIKIQGADYDEASSHIELNKDSYIVLKENSEATIIGVKEIKVGGKAIIKETDWTYANKRVDIKAHAMTSIKIEINVKSRMPTSNIDWATKKVDGTHTLYDLAKTATNIKFIKSDDTTSGTLCGEGDNDKVYYTFESNVLTVWAKDKIAFKDNDLAEEGSDGLFYECGEVTSIDTSNIDTYELTNFDDCFGSCKKLKDLDVTNIDTSSATTFQFMFYECEELTSLDLRCFDTKNVTDIGRMFYGCKKLTNLDVTSFDTSKVTAMFGTFSMCPLLTTLDLSSFDTSKVTTTSIMFSGDSELTTIYASNKFDISQLGEYMHDNMFDSCTKLKGGKGTTYNGGIIDKTRAKIDGGPGNEGYFTEKK